MPQTNNKNKKPTTQDPTRDIASNILYGVLFKEQPLEKQTADTLKRFAPDLRDKKAAHRLTYATLRDYGFAKEVLRCFIRKMPPPPAELALVMGVIQLLVLDTPHHAAVNTTIELLRRRQLPKYTSLCNGALRNIIRHKDKLLEKIDREKANIPRWLWKSWEDFSTQTPRLIAQAIQNKPPTDITYQRHTRAQPPQDAKQLHNATYRLFGDQPVTSIDGYDEGSFWVQDFAATIPAPLLKAQKGEKIADLCAAPGGKTAQLCQTGADITSVDRNKKRCHVLKENIKRLHLKVTEECIDVNDYNPPHPFDGILLDAPCTGTGIIRRHPDILWTKTQQDVTRLCHIQKELLKKSWDLLKSGGRLVYCVCSLQKQEGEEQLKTAIDIGFKHAPIQKEELSFLPQALTPEGFYRSFPYFLSDIGGMDGFFAMRLIKP